MPVRGFEDCKVNAFSCHNVVLYDLGTGHIHQLIINLVSYISEDLRIASFHCIIGAGCTRHWIKKSELKLS